jgi:sugar lactone lactonase YvrE
MKGRLRLKRWRRGLPAALLGLGLGLGVASCSNGPPALGASFTPTAATASGDYTLPLDSVPTSDGKTFYFTAMSNNGTDMGVFRVDAAGGAATPVFVGAPFASPFGIAISSDDSTLYIADSAAGHDPNDPAGDSKSGALYTLPVGGGTPTVVAETVGLRPRGVEVSKKDNNDVVYFTGTGTDGRAAVFKLEGGLQTVAAGDPLTDPGGVAISRTNQVYVTNTAQGDSGLSSVYQVDSGTPTEIAGGIRVGYPAGISISQDGKTLLVSGQDATLGTATVYRINVDTREVSSVNAGLENNPDAGGLHRARNSDVFSWCGVTVGTGGSGLVYRIEFK